MNDSVFYYEIKQDNTICIHHAFGISAHVIVPDYIDGKIVNEISSYCFSQSNKEYMNYLCTSTYDENIYFEQAGKSVEIIELPDSIEKLGNCAFYNCRFLKRINISNKLKEVGSDCFMNCLRLHTLYLNANINEKTVLKQVLAQIIWDLVVYFKQDKTEAILFFPEYFESYIDLGPAHIFGLNMNGEGFRTRQSFEDNILKIDQYDKVFEKLKAEESERVLCTYAFYRLYYPICLHDDIKKQYVEYLKEHKDAYFITLIDQFDIQELIHIYESFIQQEIIDVYCLNRIMDKVTNKQLIELSVELNILKKKYFKVKKTYDFEDF